MTQRTKNSTKQAQLYRKAVQRVANSNRGDASQLARELLGETSNDPAPMQVAVLSHFMTKGPGS